MKPHFVIFNKEGKPFEKEGKTMVYNLFSVHGKETFKKVYAILTKKHPGLISISETKGEYCIQVKQFTSGYIHTIKCEKFPSVCVPTTYIETIRELQIADI